MPEVRVGYVVPDEPFFAFVSAKDTGRNIQHLLPGPSTD